MSDNGSSKHTKVPIAKETYTADEKKMIMDRLDKERRIHNQAVKGLDGKKGVYDDCEKSKILDQLNEARLSQQKRVEIEKKRTDYKKVYKFGSQEYYKFKNMEREYYIKIEDCHKVYCRPNIITLYYRTFDEFQKKDVLLKTEVYSDKFFISYNAIRVYFKSYSLEDER